MSSTQDLVIVPPLDEGSVKLNLLSDEDREALFQQLLASMKARALLEEKRWARNRATKQKRRNKKLANASRRRNK